MKITVFGSSSDSIDKKYFTDAEKLAGLLAAEGHTVVYGGGKNGLIGLFAADFIAAGGKVTGIAPKLFETQGMLNILCDDFIFTDTVSDRINRMIEYGDCIIALPGGAGTFEEIFCTLSAVLLGSISAPIILLNTADYYSRIRKLLQNAVKENFLSPYAEKILSYPGSPEELLALLKDKSIFNVESRDLANYLK